MALSVGIVGLPNVGKSTFFNAITNCSAEAQNYPFCTIEPNTGIVPIPDPRLEALAKLSASKKLTPAVITFTDIAGLVKGAAKGEGLGNKFLSHIREVSAIAHVVRCFEDDNIIHVSGKINPLDDIEVVNTELILADLEMAEKMLANLSRSARSVADKDDKTRAELLTRIKQGLERGIPARGTAITEDERALLKGIDFLTDKKVIYVANVSEGMLGTASPQIEAVKKFAESQGDEFAVICARTEEEISKLEKEEKKEFLKELGIVESGLDVIARKCMSLLGLQTYLTTGEKETRAWTIKKGDTAPKAAGVIHSDFERGFIRANIVSYVDLVKYGNIKDVREKGLLRQEGKDYIMQDGDVVEFLFNV
ncbi:MAG: redox-regulated ATPase YchF [Elusimicrobiota bacterium]